MCYKYSYPISGWGYKSLMWVISLVTLHITPFITTHEPPSRVAGFRAHFGVSGRRHARFRSRVFRVKGLGCSVLGLGFRV